MYRFPLVLVASVALAAGTVAANAQAAGSTDTGYASAEDYPVMSRPRPEYDPKGIPLGGFRLFPSLEVTGTYDNNVFRTETGAANDYFVDVAPSLRLQSEWGRDMLELYGGVSNYDYAKYTRENLTDWDAGADGRLDILGGSSIYAAGSAAELHEMLSSPNTTGFQAAPNRYYQYHGETNVVVQPNRFGVSFGGTVDSYDYLNTPLIGGGSLGNQDRNFNEYQGYAKASYDFSPGYSAFLRGSYDTRQFKVYLDRTGVHRSSTGYRADGGVDLEITHLLSGEIYLGYLKQNFAAPLKGIGELDYSVKLDWLATPLLTVHLLGSRALNETTLAGASVEDDKSIGISADYELLNDLIVQAHATYVDTSFPGIVRHDEAPDLGIGIKFLANRYASADLAYDFTERATSATGLKFQDHTVTLGLNLHD